jgi:hypothetical protein
MADYLYMMVLELVPIVDALLTDPQHGRQLCKSANIAKLPELLRRKVRCPVDRPALAMDVVLATAH